MKTTGIVFSPIVYGRNAPATLPAFFNDSSRNGFVGTFTGGLAAGDWTLINNTIYAPLFNGTTDYISVPDNSLLSFGNAAAGTDRAFSVMSWVNMTDATGFPIILKGVYNTSGEWRFLCHDSDDKIRWQMFDESVANCYIGRTYSTALTANEGTWIHLAGTYDASETSAGCKIYLNGVQVDNANEELNAVSYVAMESGAADVHIGRDDATYGEGYISPDTKIINYELGATQVAKYYAQTRNLYGV